MTTYSSLEEYKESDEFKEYREVIIESKKIPTIQEEEFSLDSIDFLEQISYPISWGIDKLNDEIGGQPLGKYIMLYGGPSTGKTTLTLQIAIDNQQLDNDTCYLSFEMPKKDFIIQNMRTRAGIKHKGIGTSVLPTPEQQIIMKDFIEDIRPIEIKGYVNQPSLQEFKTIMESLTRSGYKLIIIDNMGMIGREGGSDEMKLYGEISAFIKNYVDKNQISVLILHHTNKGSEASNGKRGFSAFRGNGKIADDCDYVVQLQREFLENGETQSTIKIEKDRIAGRNGYSLPLTFNKGRFQGDAFI